MTLDAPTAPPRFAWLNGAVVPWDQCVLQARAPGSFWGANVFEGVRAYWIAERHVLQAFRLDDHLRRLRRSMKCLRLSIDYSDEQLVAACRDLAEANDFRQDLHIVITAYVDTGDSLDPMAHSDASGVHITAVPVARRSGSAGLAAGVSSWRRIADDTMPPAVKTGANYQNSRLAAQEATRNGFDTALLLNNRGTLAEGPGSCLVVVRNGELTTPPGTSSVLEGITVATVAELAARELGVGMKRVEVDRTDLYLADEAFLCGTLHEVLPLTSVDRIPIGDGEVGPITQALIAHYAAAVRADPAGSTWITSLLGALAVHA